jgi:hypothetical protein
MEASRCCVAVAGCARPARLLKPNDCQTCPHARSVWVRLVGHVFDADVHVKETPRNRNAASSLKHRMYAEYRIGGAPNFTNYLLLAKNSEQVIA